MPRLPGTAWLGKCAAVMPEPPKRPNPFPGRPGGSPGPSSRSEIMARLTLSALERAQAEPQLWREPTVHRAVLVSGLSLLMGALLRLNAELAVPGPDDAVA